MEACVLASAGRKMACTAASLQAAEELHIVQILHRHHKVGNPTINLPPSGPVQLGRHLNAMLWHATITTCCARQREAGKNETSEWRRPIFFREILNLPLLVRTKVKKGCTMKVVPLGDKVVVKRLEPQETTPGGIVLPDSSRDKPVEGRVLSVGDGRMLPDGQRVPHQVREGDRVVFSRFAGTEVVVDNEDVLIMGEEDLLAVLE